MQVPLKFILHLADNSLLMSQRLGEWTGHGPALEQDIALTNIGLDLLGQSRLFYQLAAARINEQRIKAEFVPQALYPISEDDLAYLRVEHQFASHLLLELPNGHWGQTILKLAFFARWQHIVYAQLLSCADQGVAAIAEKSLKEVQYHVKWSSDWVVRLGDGTTESHNKMAEALAFLWPYTGELFEQTNWNMNQVNWTDCRQKWQQGVNEMLYHATLELPEITGKQSGGLRGIHTEYMGYLLAEMQYLQRVYPGNQW
jgi:ring-1,2-phenylacetyl-CoA epoxidase subunit PaaC